eukprot:801268-Amphidinium_carterae.1
MGYYSAPNPTPWTCVLDRLPLDKAQQRSKSSVDPRTCKEHAVVALSAMFAVSARGALLHARSREGMKSVQCLARRSKRNG